jgi:hypothetical protein
MRLAAIIAGTSLCLASSSPIRAQDSARGTHAVTRVAAPLRENPDVSARRLRTIPPRTSVAVTSCAEGWCTVQYQRLTGHVIEVFLRFPHVEAQKRAAAGRGYVNSRGEWVPSPVHTPDGRAPAGASAQCRDGSYSFSRSRQGTCSHHGGVGRWL